MVELHNSFKFPTTRYSGSKRKFLEWIWENISDIKFNTTLDLFGGTGSVSLLFKSKGKSVHYNDILAFNQIIGTAIVENKSTIVTEDELNTLFNCKNKLDKKVIQEYYTDIFFLNEENTWLDNFIHELYKIEDTYKKAIILSALFQACLSKRPFNLFHRANLNIRLADVKRNFGNKRTWEKSFEELVKKFVFEYNNAVFDNGKSNKVIGGHNALVCPNGVDLVYIDPPYFSAKHSKGLDYLEFYNFLEGVANYNKWEDLIQDRQFKVPKFERNPGIKDFTSKEKVKASIERLINRFQDNIIVMSYLNDGIPSEEEIISIFKKYGKKVKVKEKLHKYALSKEHKKELLFIAK